MQALNPFSEGIEKRRDTIPNRQRANMMGTVHQGNVAPEGSRHPSEGLTNVRSTRGINPILGNQRNNKADITIGQMKITQPVTTAFQTAKRSV